MTTSSNTINDNLKLLTAFCKSNPTETDIKKITIYLNRSTEKEYEELIKLSLQHGILPMVHKNITRKKQMHNKRSWQEFMQQLKPYYIHIAQTNMRISAELIYLINLLKENGIEALSFKGPLLAQMAYGDITLRQYADLDILIKKEDIRKVDMLMKKEGYRYFIPLTTEQQKHWIKYAHDIGFMHKEKCLYVEMHWSFLDHDHPLQVDLKEFWNEIQGVNLNGHLIPTFSKENLLYYLCVHGSTHLWERITWIKDLDMILRQKSIDWDLFSSKIENSDFKKMVYLGLHLTVLLFDSPLPKKIQIKIQHYQKIDTLSNFVLKSWETSPSTFAKTSAMLKLLPNLRAKLLYLYKIILKPSTKEYAAINLPRGLYWGYYLVRPYLLIKKYISKK